LCFRPFPLPLPFQARRLNGGATISARKCFFGIRWLTIGLIMLGAMVNFLSRATLAVAAPVVMTNLHISTMQYSWITGAFQGAIMLQPVVGYVIDLLGVKTGFAIFALAWSLISMAHGLATSWQILAGLRAGLGFAEGAFSPGGLKVVSEWFPARERGLAGGLFNIGQSIGQMLAPPLVVGDSSLRLASRLRLGRDHQPDLGGALACFLSPGRPSSLAQCGRARLYREWPGAGLAK
jgi:MFS family permease